MKKFVFSLQSLLNVKLALEKQTKAELSAAQERLNGFVRELNAMLARHARQRIEYLQKLQEGMPSQDLQGYGIGFATARDNQKRQEEKIAVAEAEKKRIQKKLVDVMSERKMLEQLKEKKLEEYKTEIKREEAVVVQDFLSSKIAAAKE